MILCYARYIASTVPRYGIGVSGKLSPWHGGMRCMKHVHHLLQRLPSRMRGKGKHTCGRSTSSALSRASKLPENVVAE
jgi:hypothetical protein